MNILVGLLSYLLVGLVFLTGILPAIAATEIVDSTELEAQVLEIIRSHPDVIIESVQAYQQQQQELEAQRQKAVVEELMANPQLILGNSPKQGQSEQIILVEFSDFQCPFCARAHQTVKQFVEQHLDDITFTYKYFPLTAIHPQAMPAAQAAWAADQQGKFWEYHDALFEQQNNLGEDLYLELAQTLGLDIERFNGDRTGAAARAAIQQDMFLAEQLRIGSTPFFIMNTALIPGAVPLEKFENTFEQVKSQLAASEGSNNLKKS